ncbi:MAG: ABC transporter ATP-binding protein [Mycobacteriaceae bacterium]|nr:ABC transporter ATP-binding protein [Mycobacteriaceae bacterium]
MAEDIVSTLGLSKVYGSVVAVDGVDMTVRRGEVYGFLGPNGAGKTTTLRMLVGLIRPSAGSALVFGGRPGDPRVARRTGVLIEGPGFYPYLSGRDNLRVLARYRGLGDAAADLALDRAGLASRGRDPFRAYSLGMKQRLGVAAALLGDPDLLILDEPTNGLDPAGVAEMRTLIRDLAAEGYTVLLSSHMLGEVQQICDRIGVISAGTLLSEATVADLRGASSLVIDAEPLEQALAVVRAGASGHEAMVTNGGIRVEAARSDVPALARALVAAGVELRELRVDERSLEDVFFELTDDRKGGR